MECTAEVPLDASNISIGWFLHCNQLYNNSDITIISVVSASTVRSQLTIENLSDRYAGKYTCNFLGDEEFIPSDPLSLPTGSEAAVLGTPCALDLIHSKEEEKCTELLENGTIPLSLTCTDSDVSSTSLSDITMTSAATVHSTTIYMSTPHVPQNGNSMPDPRSGGKNTTSGSTRAEQIPSGHTWWQQWLLCCFCCYLP